MTLVMNDLGKMRDKITEIQRTEIQRTEKISISMIEITKNLDQNNISVREEGL